MDKCALDNLTCLTALMDTRQDTFKDIMLGTMESSQHVHFSAGGRLYCTDCHRVMSMNIEVLYPPHVTVVGYDEYPALPGVTPPEFEGKPAKLEKWGISEASMAPSMYRFYCRNCSTKYTAMVYEGPSGAMLVVFASSLGGLSTHHTPPLVRYYLDEAYRCQSAGAMSAAVAMYRTALENLLFEQHYEKVTLNSKLKSLETDRANGTAPGWTNGLNPEFLNVLRELGNVSVHPNKGDISRQARLDGRLVVAVRETFAELLHRVYEAPFEEAERLKRLADGLGKD